MDASLLSEIEALIGLDRRSIPTARLVDEACWAIANSITKIDEDAYLPTCSPKGVVESGALVHAVTSDSLSDQVVKWGIIRLVNSRYLGAEIAAIELPQPVNPVAFSDKLGVQTSEPSVSSARWRSTSRPANPRLTKSPNTRHRGGFAEELRTNSRLLESDTEVAV
jgi:hypothetical protein